MGNFLAKSRLMQLIVVSETDNMIVFVSSNFAFLSYTAECTMRGELKGTVDCVGVRLQSSNGIRRNKLINSQ